MMKDKDQPVAVLGVGVEGRASIEYLLRNGYTDVTALDKVIVEGLPSGVRSVFGDDHADDLGRFRVVIRSAGIRPDALALEAARAAGTTVTSAVQLFLERCPCPVAAVTGTLGKGTCASLCAAMLAESGYRTHLGGNIGRSPLEFLDELEEKDRVVLEISSFQAFDLTLSPRVGVALRTTSEHLDWHRSEAEYRAAKANLFAHQGPSDVLVYNADCPGAAQISARSRARKLPISTQRVLGEGLFVEGDRLRLRFDKRDEQLAFDASHMALRGRFNLENVAAALAAAWSLGAKLEPSCVAGEEFENLPHRLERVISAGGVDFVNDSYATRPEATMGAVSGFADTPLALVLGGSEKHADFGPLVEALRSHPTLVFVGLIGATAPRLLRALEEIETHSCETKVFEGLEPAMTAAAQSVSSGGTVLLSPACASFGLFPNYKVRGERFRAHARLLAQSLPVEGGPRQKSSDK